MVEFGYFRNTEKKVIQNHLLLPNDHWIQSITQVAAQLPPPPPRDEIPDFRDVVDRIRNASVGLKTFLTPLAP